MYRDRGSKQKVMATIDSIDYNNMLLITINIFRDRISHRIIF